MLANLPLLSPPYLPLTRQPWAVGDQNEIWGNLKQFMKSVLETDCLPYNPSKPQSLCDVPDAGDDLSFLASSFPVFDVWMDLYQPGYWYSPEIEIFFSSVATSEIGRLRRVLSAAGGSEDDIAHKRLYNNLIQSIRCKAEAKNLSKKMTTLRFTLTEQRKSIEEYILSMTQFKVLRFVRLDHFYENSPFDDNDALLRMPWGQRSRDTAVATNFDNKWLDRPETRGRIDIATIMQHRNTFFSTRDRDDPMVGYISKIEQGGRHGVFHMHSFLIYDGSKVRDSQLEALAVANDRRWKDVTGGTGLTFDSRNRKDVVFLRQQNRWALDPLKSGDGAGLIRLLEYLRYFTDDKGQLLLVKPSEKANAFTKGHKPTR